MTDDVLNAFRPLLTRLGQKLPADPEFRTELAALARALADWLAPASVPQAAPPPPDPVVAPVPSVFVKPSTPSIESLPRLTFADPLPAPIRARAEELGKAPPAVPMTIVARCRLKAEACNLIATSGYDPTSSAAHELIRKAKELDNCQLWMLMPGDYNTAAAAWKDLVLAFEAGAVAAELLQAWYQSPTEMQTRTAEDVLHLVAEAQSTLLSATVGVGRWAYDQDQLEIYLTVAAETKTRRVYVRRYLRREDRADPAKAADLKRRLVELLAQVKTNVSVSVNRKKLLSNLKFKLGRLATDRVANADEWPLVMDLLDKLVSDGVPPSSPELRDPLLSVYNELPDTVAPTKNALLVFREVERFDETQKEIEEPAESKADRWSEEVEKVAELLQGRAMVLIGGQVRPPRREALIRAFRLSDLEWVSTPEHTSITYFEPFIARPETSVVLLAIRWSNHDYSEVQQYCEKYGKLLVRLPAGYHPNQVAHQIWNQIGEQLIVAKQMAG